MIISIVEQKFACLEKTCQNFSSNRDYHLNHRKTFAIPIELLKIYDFKKIINKGSFGVIFQIYKKFSDEKTSFALKLVTDYSKENLEIEILMKLKEFNPKNVISVIDFKKEVNYYYVVMELGEGTLRDDFKFEIIRTGLEKLQILHQICSAIEFLHGHFIAHLDIKPENLVKVNNQFKIIDFGVATFFSDSKYEHKTKGTKKYMPPEMFQKNCKYFPHEADIWAFGILSFEIIFDGKYPFPQGSLVKSSDFKIDLSIFQNTPIISHLFRGCFEFEPSKRIKISQIIDLLKKLDESQELSNVFPIHKVKILKRSYEIFNPNSIFENNKKKEYQEKSNIFEEEFPDNSLLQYKGIHSSSIFTQFKCSLIDSLQGSSISFQKFRNLKVENSHPIELLLLKELKISINIIKQNICSPTSRNTEKDILRSYLQSLKESMKIIYEIKDQQVLDINYASKSNLVLNDNSTFENILDSFPRCSEKMIKHFLFKFEHCLFSKNQEKKNFDPLVYIQNIIYAIDLARKETKKKKLKKRKCSNILKYGLSPKSFQMFKVPHYLNFLNFRSERDKQTFFRYILEVQLGVMSNNPIFYLEFFTSKKITNGIFLFILAKLYFQKAYYKKSLSLLKDTFELFKENGPEQNTDFFNYSLFIYLKSLIFLEEWEEYKEILELHGKDLTINDRLILEFYYAFQSGDIEKRTEVGKKFLAQSNVQNHNFSDFSMIFTRVLFSSPVNKKTYEGILLNSKDPLMDIYFNEDFRISYNYDRQNWPECELLINQSLDNAKKLNLPPNSEFLAKIYFYKISLLIVSKLLEDIHNVVVRTEIEEKFSYLHLAYKEEVCFGPSLFEKVKLKTLEMKYYRIIGEKEKMTNLSLEIEKIIKNNKVKHGILGYYFMHKAIGTEDLEEAFKIFQMSQNEYKISNGVNHPYHHWIEVLKAEIVLKLDKNDIFFDKNCFDSLINKYEVDQKNHHRVGRAREVIRLLKEKKLLKNLI